MTKFILSDEKCLAHEDKHLREVLGNYLGYKISGVMVAAKVGAKPEDVILKFIGMDRKAIEAVNVAIGQLLAYADGDDHGSEAE